LDLDLNRFHIKKENLNLNIEEKKHQLAVLRAANQVFQTLCICKMAPCMKFEFVLGQMTSFEVAKNSS
jgi:hypothetical protein